LPVSMVKALLAIVAMRQSLINEVLVGPSRWARGAR
jgi:hypothetical protein